MPRENPAERIARLRKDPKWREKAGNFARSMLQRAHADKGELEDKLTEVATSMQPERGGIPLSFRDGDGKVHLKGGQLVQATPHDIENYTQAPTRVCGTCRHFKLKEGQKKMMDERFAERIVLEEEWKLHHLGAPLDHFGVCDASGGQMATTTVSKADDCASYRPRNRLFRR